ncbi:gluconokinase [Dyella sedimenti]|uniref:gluconokinase n=1 Tax=Dyella sedimenti TaxID=2919947 RepID=UPI001FAA391E|nr:gluconokinase [Dyella sedimenti]
MTNTMRAIVAMGVAGCGKSSVATALCERLGAHLIEGDAFHPERNIHKMASGTPLTDADRQDWLDALARELAHAVASHRRTVLTCSALKRRYREVLRAAEPGLGFVFLALPPEEAARRVAQRSHHFMPATLVESQFRDLEPPTGEPRVLTVDATDPVAVLVERIMAWWQ